MIIKTDRGVIVSFNDSLYPQLKTKFEEATPKAKELKKKGMNALIYFTIEDKEYWAPYTTLEAVFKEDLPVNLYSKLQCKK